MTLTVTLRCAVCGTVTCESEEEADRRADYHVKVTRHPVTVEARRHDDYFDLKFENDLASDWRGDDA